MGAGEGDVSRVDRHDPMAAVEAASWVEQEGECSDVQGGPSEVEELDDGAIPQRGVKRYALVQPDGTVSLKIAGVLVFGYVNPDGYLVISMHFDEADPEVFGETDGGEVIVPVELNVGGTVVYRVDEHGNEERR